MFRRFQISSMAPPTRTPPPTLCAYLSVSTIYIRCGLETWVRDESVRDCVRRADEEAFYCCHTVWWWGGCDFLAWLAPICLHC